MQATRIHTPEELALARRVADHIEANPSVLDMSIYVEFGRGCGTVGCIAGWAVLLSDGPDAVKLGDPYEEDDGYWVRHPATGEPVSIEERAAELLGLNKMQADYWFYLPQYAVEETGVRRYITEMMEASEL